MLKKCFALLLVLSFMANFALAADVPSSSPAPKKWRVIYLEGGPYIDYQQIFAGTIRSLAKLGIIANGDVPVPKNSESTKEMWEWLVQNAGGDKLEFLSDGYYSSGWDDKMREADKAEILKRIADKNDVDMILAFGTAAGLDMAKSEHNIPVFSMSVTDAVSAGIVDSIEDSGKDNVHSQLEPGRTENQVSVFHDIFKFKRMGIAYEDSLDGRGSGNISAIENTAKKLGIELVHCTAQLNVPDLDVSFNNLKTCVTELSKTSDAIFLTTNTGMQPTRILELLDPIIEAKIPSFSQNGPAETKLGVLLSLAQSNFDDVGMFEAEAIEQLLQGKKMREINQVFEAPLGLAINLKMAILIDWNPPFEILVAVDEIHQNIENASYEE